MVTQQTGISTQQKLMFPNVSLTVYKNPSPVSFFVSVNYFTAEELIL